MTTIQEAELAVANKPVDLHGFATVATVEAFDRDWHDLIGGENLRAAINEVKAQAADVVRKLLAEAGYTHDGKAWRHGNYIAEATVSDLIHAAIFIRLDGSRVAYASGWHGYTGD